MIWPLLAALAVIECYGPPGAMWCGTPSPAPKVTPKATATLTPTCTPTSQFGADNRPRTYHESCRRVRVEVSPGRSRTYMIGKMVMTSHDPPEYRDVWECD